MRKLIRSIGLAIAHKFGARITDYRTGKVLGRAIIFPWRGRIHVIGLQSSVIPTFMAQQRLTYWKQELGLQFTINPILKSCGGSNRTERRETKNKIDH